MFNHLRSLGRICPHLISTPLCRNMPASLTHDPAQYWRVGQTCWLDDPEFGDVVVIDDLRYDAMGLHSVHWRETIAPAKSTASMNWTPLRGRHEARRALSTDGRFGRLRRTGTGRRWVTRCHSLLCRCLI